ncbi:hypothetical protein QTP88_001580 [Uroleucon formosanum]
MPDVGATLEFENWQHAQRHPFTIYADFEALLVKTNEKRGKHTTVIHNHKPMSYGFLVKASEDVPLELIERFNIPSAPVIYRGSNSREDVARHFLENIADVGHKIEELLKTNTPIVMSDEDTRKHNSNKNCNFCKRSFDTIEKVRNHCHLTGRFRQSLCSQCNLKLKQPKFVPCFFHDLTNYDAHFIVTELGYDTNSIKVIANSEEKFISFSKYICRSFTIRFVDTCRFMQSKLSTLAKNLLTKDFSKFRETAKYFDDGDMPFVTRKGVYPYEYTDGWDKLDVTSLPSKEDFYSTLKEKGVKDTHYDHAMEVWRRFECQTLGDYSDLYLKVDVLLLADVFENFRDLCMKTYNLDPAFYYTAPSFSFDSMLKYTSIKLGLLTDYDMLLYIEKGIRGGLVQAIMRYAKANNPKVPDYDETKEKSWVIYQDCNNLYGWAMSQYMPFGGFKWVEAKLDGLNSLDDTSPIGRMYEVDVTCPLDLHDKHNDLPFLPENCIPEGSKVKKLMATFESKKNYVVHYRKTMEQVRRRIHMELVSNDARVQKLINLTTFKYATSYNENLSAITLEKKNYKIR